MEPNHGYDGCEDDAGPTLMLTAVSFNLVGAQA